MPRIATTVLCVAASCLWAGMVAAASQADKCEANKLKRAGQHGLCRLKAEAKAVKTGEPPDYAKCDAKFNEQWMKAETTGGGMCPTNGDAAAMQARITKDVNAIVACLNGDCLLTPAFPATGQTSCWGSGGQVIPCAGTGQDGDLQAGATLAYGDNGDGTITDLNTGLMWEKLSDDGGIHDRNNLYTWDDAFAVKVAALNAASFAGYSDWRVPNIKELHSITDYGGCCPALHPVFNTACVPACTVLTCSCSASPSTHWSSTTQPGSMPQTGLTAFHGHVGSTLKSSTNAVRAVRGGL